MHTRRAGAAGEVPVGAVVLDSAGTVVAEAENRRVRDLDPTAHAEILALRAAGRQLANWCAQHTQGERAPASTDARCVRCLARRQLPGCTVVVSLEPCAMCRAAIAEARIGAVVFAAARPLPSSRTPLPLPVTTVTEDAHVRAAAEAQLRDWFARRRC